MKNRIIVLAMLSLLLGVNIGAQSAKPIVIASHSILADVARNIAGDHLDVRTLISLGSDPHTFIPTPSDLAAVADADLVLVNGMGYEESLLDAIENAGETVNISLASACIDVRPLGAHEDDDDHMNDDEDEDNHMHEDEDEHSQEDEDDDEHAHEDDDDDHGHEEDDDHADELTGCDAQDAEFASIVMEEAAGHEHGASLGRAEDIDCEGHDHGDEGDGHAQDEGACDPHVWLDPHNVIRWALSIRNSFSEIDPDHAGEYHERALAYAAELDSLERDFIVPALENLPEEKRLLVTAHESLGYLASTFGFEIVSTVIPGVSTAVEPSARDVAELIDLIRQREVPAIFGETTTSDKVLQVVAAETGVGIAPLYTDSLSTSDGPAATYLDYMRYNFTTIVEALSG